MKRIIMTLVFDRFGKDYIEYKVKFDGGVGGNIFAFIK